MSAPEHPGQMSVSVEPPVHGGDLHRAAERYGRPLTLTAPEQAWLDLSAALNPRPYPLPSADITRNWQLPGDLEPLLQAARDYYGAAQAVALPGSQAAIQWLPLLRPRGRVAVPSVGYREHGFRWQWAGHAVVTYDPADAAGIDALLSVEGEAAVDVLVVINPNNPSGDCHAPTQLLGWRERLAARGGWLVVDEAFADCEPALSVAAASDRPGLVVLRSLGKFFGLPGVRCGFALCDAELVARLTVAVGPWPLAAQSVEAALTALTDRRWQTAARQQLRAMATANRNVLRRAFAAAPQAGCDLFTTVRLSRACATEWQARLGEAGIWTRLIELDAGSSARRTDQALLRFGLVDPDREVFWRRYVAALGVQ